MKALCFVISLILLLATAPLCHATGNIWVEKPYLMDTSQSAASRWGLGLGLRYKWVYTALGGVDAQTTDKKYISFLPPEMVPGSRPIGKETVDGKAYWELGGALPVTEYGFITAGALVTYVNEITLYSNTGDKNGLLTKKPAGKKIGAGASIGGAVNIPFHERLFLTVGARYTTERWLTIMVGLGW